MKEDYMPTDTDLLSGIYSAIINSLSIPYIVSTNILIYLIIKFIDYLNKEKYVPGITKKIITAIVGLSMGILFHFIGTTTTEVLITSFLVVPFSYKYIIKYILKTFGVYYRDLPGKTEEEDKKAADDAMNSDSNINL